MRKLFFLLTLLAALFVAETTFAYTVQKGDTMMKIAKKNGITLEELSKANPQITNIDLIYVGQHIHLHNEKHNPKSSSETSKDHVETLSEKELDLLARIVRAEAQTEPFEGKVAVADVVLNRLESPQFPDTIKEVIYEPGQFEPVMNGQVDQPADEESIEAVDAALSDMRNITEDSLFFYNPAIATNRWLDTRETTVVIGQHEFKH
ncbi:cell wall hydrolase [Halalkalibacter alkaliphilus]|uniref:Cell wall hydrolase n=1 Tax=Halalkalibacter alkaliphilus TaxID=2917993 RepID=A0A9X1ZYW3_9BACI|nr:cell wall hydrolase [Halalkalibacter alkaliphilus]MCL7745600.1 cell wall hydrolase [Halalkalibacter alkaliphilus]